MIYIFSHLGLGDHIICNGIVRYYSEIYEKVFVFVRQHNFSNVSYMYRDNSNIIPIDAGDEFEVEDYIKENKLLDKVIKVGFDGLTFNEETTFDVEFYKTIGLDFSLRFDKFYFLRDYQIESDILKKLNPNNEKYIFTHGVDHDRVSTEYKIITNPIEYKVFDLLTLIENAEEVHIMESSIKNIINSYKFKKPKIYFHTYSRGYSNYYHSVGLNDFIYIN